MNQKKIGFVDLYISEWHANNYPVWMREIAEKLGYGYEIAYAYAEEDVSPVDGRTTAEWCEQFGVTACATIGELCEKSDCIVILAPSNPEAHLRLAAAVLPYGKRTYIDKTFAPNYEEAAAIFALADQYGTQCFSTSALRYASELEKCGSTVLCLDYAQDGIGSNSCGPALSETYRFVKKSFDFKLNFYLQKC